LIVSLDSLSLQINALVHHTVAVQSMQAQTRTAIILPNGDADTRPIAESFPVSMGDWRTDWCTDLIHRLGNNQPTKSTIDYCIAWTMAEDSRDGPGTAHARWNPLNTTQTGFNQTETINGDGVKGYADYESGMGATIQTLSYSFYTEIVAGLQSNDPERALRGLYASPWGTDADDVNALWRR